MIKNSFLAGLLALSFSLPASADLKIAVVDTGKAFDAYYKTKETAIRIEAKEAGYKKEIFDLQTEYQQSSQEAQTLEDAAKNPSLPDEVRKQKDTELAQKVQDLQTMEQELGDMTKARSQEIRDELRRSHQEISDVIVKAITDYAGPQGYDLVLDKSFDAASAQISRLPFNSARVVDITEQIIARLNASAPPS